jgi:hypothetical protein
VRSRSKNHSRKVFVVTIGARYGLLTCALFVSALMFAAEALAAPRAAELGPEMPLAEPAGGFLGKLSVTPQGGPAERTLP